MTEPAPLSAVERLAWRAAAWLMTGACGALTVWGFSATAPAGPPSSTVAARAAVQRPAAEPPRRHRCTRGVAAA